MMSSDLQLIQGGKGEAIRIRAILRSLIPVEDLEGVISIPFQIPSISKGDLCQATTQNCGLAPCTLERRWDFCCHSDPLSHIVLIIDLA